MLRAAYYALDDLYQRHIYERPSAHYRRALLREAHEWWPDFREKAEALCREGCLILPRYFGGDALREMQEQVNRWAPGVASEQGRPGQINLSEKKGVLLRNSPALSRAGTDPYLLSLVSYYWGKPVFLSMSYGFRLEPDPRAKREGPFQWHHDANRKQVKVYVLLTDVSPDGQRMDYIPGTHTLWHRFRPGESGYNETRVPEETALRAGQPVRCAGPAGTALIFDTNGIHTGNRNLSARRDAWVFQYTAGRHLQPLSGIHPDVYRNLNSLQRRVLRSRNLAPSSKP